MDGDEEILNLKTQKWEILEQQDEVRLESEDMLELKCPKCPYYYDVVFVCEIVAHVVHFTGANHRSPK